jgi:hypothetical protein
METGMIEESSRKQEKKIRSILDGEKEDDKMLPA